MEYKHIYRLYPEKWLNDEIINIYMGLLADRAENDQSLLKIHCFNTFFCETLHNKGYAKVGQWTQKERVDIFEENLVFVPINRKFHCTLGVIDMEANEIIVYDSMGGNNDGALNLLLDYLKEEYQAQKHAPFDSSK